MDASLDSCRPFAHIPAWWSGFLFHVLNPRQVCIYTYMSMLWDDHGTCRPTVEQMRDDLGLLSASMVFEALTVLESLGFILREKAPGARQNVYRRTSCEYTIRKLLEAGKIDAALRPAPYSTSPASAEAAALAEIGIRELLGDRYERYERATPEARRDVLLEELQASA